MGVFLITACGCGNGFGLVIATPIRIVLATKIQLREKLSQNFMCGLQVPR